MKTRDLIALLAEDAPSTVRIDRAVAAAIAGGIVIAAAIFALWIGPRADIARAAETLRFLFKFVLTIALAIGACGALLRLARPDRDLGVWRWGLAVAPVLLLLASGLELMAEPSSDWMRLMRGHNMRFCLTLLPLMALGPLACFILALRAGAPSRPGLAGLVAGLAASAIAATFYAANCNDDSPLFVLAWYPISIGTMALLGYLAGRRFLRW